MRDIKMKQYLDQWNIIEGALTVERISQVHNPV